MGHAKKHPYTKVGVEAIELIKTRKKNHEKAILENNVRNNSEISIKTWCRNDN